MPTAQPSAAMATRGLRGLPRGGRVPAGRRRRPTRKTARSMVRLASAELKPSGGALPFRFRPAPRSRRWPAPPRPVWRIAKAPMRRPEQPHVAAHHLVGKRRIQPRTVAYFTRWRNGPRRLRSARRPRRARPLRSHARSPAGRPPVAVPGVRPAVQRRARPGSRRRVPPAATGRRAVEAVPAILVVEGSKEEVAA